MRVLVTGLGLADVRQQGAGVTGGESCYAAGLLTRLGERLEALSTGALQALRSLGKLAY